MKTLDINIHSDVNGVPFGTDRESVRKELGKKYKEMKKSFLSANTMDAYGDYHVYYDEDDKFEAIEIFGKTKVKIGGKQIYPGKVSAAAEILGSGKKNAEGIIYKNKSVGITFNPDDEDEIEAVLFGCKGYY